MFFGIERIDSAPGGAREGAGLGRVAYGRFYRDCLFGLCQKWPCSSAWKELILLLEVRAGAPVWAALRTGGSTAIACSLCAVHGHALRHGKS